MQMSNRGLSPATLALLLAVAVSSQPLLADPDPAGTAATDSADAAAEAASSVMDLPLDGTSLETFDQGVAMVRAEASAQQSGALESAFKMILFYDLSLAGSREKLSEKLNGMTPNEVILHAREMSR